MNRQQRNAQFLQLWPALQAKASYLASQYGHPYSDEIANDMALTVLEKADQDPEFLSQTPAYIAQFAAWRWQDQQTHERYDTRNASLDEPVAHLRPETLVLDLNLTLSDTIPDPAPTPPIQAETADRTGALRRALQSLNPAQRQALALVYSQGQGHAEAAQALGRPIGTVSWQLSQAKKQLKSALAAY